MSAPDSIDVLTLCRRSLRRAGQPLPSADMVNECANIQLQEVKADMMLWTPFHESLRARCTSGLTRGISHQTQPSDVNRLDSVILFDGPETWRGTMTSATALATTVDETSDTLIGMLLFLLSGEASGQWKQITGWDNVTKVPTLESAFDGVPDTTTVYLIANERTRLFEGSRNATAPGSTHVASLGKPREYERFNEGGIFHPTPDKTYGLWTEYYMDLSKVDEESCHFKRLMREWLSVFMQGLIAKNMQLFEDDRADNNMLIYRELLRQLRSSSLRVGQTVPYQ